MPDDWLMFERKLSFYVNALPAEIIRAADEITDFLCKELESTTPVGASSFLKNAVTDRSRVFWDGRVASAGVTPKALVGNPKSTPPRGTIRDFLEWWNDQGFQSDSDKDKNGVRSSKPKRLPWWSLSKRQKDVLQEEREGGRFGGSPPQPLYWWVQEVGNAKAGVTKQLYMSKAFEKTVAFGNARVASIKVMP